MALRLYNTLSRKTEPFEPLEPGRVRMYVCGPTVYAQAHIGHAMSAMVFDVVRRHRGLKPEGVCDLNEDGLRLARATADEAAKIVDEIDAEGGHA